MAETAASGWWRCQRWGWQRSLVLKNGAIQSNNQRGKLVDYQSIKLIMLDNDYPLLLFIKHFSFLSTILIHLPGLISSIYQSGIRFFQFVNGTINHVSCSSTILKCWSINQYRSNQSMWTTDLSLLSTMGIIDNGWLTILGVADNHC